jgi:hypothetical protein
MSSEVLFPKLAKAVAAAIQRLGISNAEVVRRTWPDRPKSTKLYPVLRGVGRLSPDSRLLLEKALGLDASVWQLDGIPDSPMTLHTPRGAPPQPNGEAGPVGRALALAAATPATAAPAPTPARFVNEVAVVFRDGRAHLRINAMVSAADGMRVMTMLQELIGEGEHDGAGSTHGGDGTDQPGTRRPGADR